jgi:hypothetical protein
MNRTVLEKLEEAKLIERCAPPATGAPQGRGRRPVYYLAVGTGLPGFTSRARGESGKSTQQIEKPVLESDLNFSGSLEQIHPGENKTGSTEPASGTTDICSAPDLLQETGKNQSPSAAGDLNLFPLPRANRVSGAEALESVERARQAAADFWT